jgi:3-phenylpropionate/cinnamic acid dioxygenase small subunit
MTMVAKRQHGRVPMTSPVYAEVAEWLLDEAELLDRNHFEEWLARLAPDLHYTMPVRETVRRGDGNGLAATYHHFDDSIGSMTTRVRRVVEATQFAEDPPSRTRRFVTNIRVFDDGAPELRAESYLLVLRSRFDSPVFDFISSERTDTLRRSDDGLQLVTRQIAVDQAVLGTPNLAIFL